MADLDVRHDEPKMRLPAGLRQVRDVVHRARWARLRIASLGHVTAAERPIIASGVKVAPRARVRLDRRIALGRDMYVEVDLDVGADVLISQRVAFVGNEHPLDGDGTVFATIAGEALPRVELVGDNLVGFASVIIAPCVMQRGAVLGAGSVATGVLEADTIYGGVPARPIRTRRR